MADAKLKLVADCIDKLDDISAELNGFYFERADTIKTLMNSMVSRQHNLQLGPPGTGKSGLVRSVMQSFNDVEFPDGSNTGAPKKHAYFEKLVGKAFPVEEILGPMSLKGLSNDEYRRVLAGFLPMATIAFLDEIYKAGPVLISPLLSIINERVYTNGAEIVSCPLRFLCAGSNELYEGEGLDAFDARLVLRTWTDYIAEKSNFVQFIKTVRTKDAPDTKQFGLKVAHIDAAFDYARTEIKWEDDATEILWTIRENFRAEGLLFDDRRAAWIAQSLVPAETVLRGGDTVEPEDFDILAHALWRKPKDRDKAQELVYKTSNPVLEEVNQFVDDAKSAWNTCESILNDANISGAERESAGMDCNATLKNIIKKLDKRADETANRTRAQFEGALDTVEEIHENVLENVMRVGRPKTRREHA